MNYLKKYFWVLIIFTCSAALGTDPENNKSQLPELDSSRFIVGGVLGIIPGFGLGHAVQGRFQKRGALFAAAEVGSFVAGWVASTIFCGGAQAPDVKCVNNFSTLSGVSFVAFKGWEIYDVWNPSGYNLTSSCKHNEKSEMSVIPYLMPMANGQIIGGINIGY